MKVLVKNEINRAFKNKWFYGVLIICFAMIVYDLFVDVIPIRTNMNLYINESSYPIPNLYNKWMELTSHSVISKLLHFIFPILICIPYSISIYDDVNSKYIYNIIIRIDKKKYFLSKLIVQFLVGFTIVMFTMIISFVFTAAILPAGTPFITLQYVFGGRNVFGVLFYNYPLFTSILLMVLETIIFALIGCLSYTFAYLLNNGIMVMVSAFTIYFFENVATPLLGVKVPLFGCTFLSTLIWESLQVLIIELIVIIVVVVITYFVRARKKDEL